jgi:uncharacterized protein (DUF2249 family)
MSVLTILDVRDIIPREKHQRIFSLFNSLQHNEVMQLVNDHDPVPLYYHFSAERKGEFEWEYMEQGPETWRVNIKKIIK